MTTNDATPREADRAVPEPDADAVGRAVFAMNKAKVEYWKEQPDLNYLDYEEAEEIERKLMPVLARAALTEQTAPPEYDTAYASDHREAYDKGVDAGYVAGLHSARSHIARMERPLDMYQISDEIGQEIRSYKRDVAVAGDDLDADMTLAYMKGRQDGQDAAADTTEDQGTSFYTYTLTQSGRAADPSIDELLDSVHPGCYIDGMKKFGNEWHVWLMWPGLMREAARGTGPTRRAAIENAVAAAKKGQSDV